MELCKHESLIVEFYKSEKVNNQQPHDRDEIYVIVSGRGISYNRGNKRESL